MRLLALAVMSLVSLSLVYTTWAQPHTLQWVKAYSLVAYVSSCVHVGNVEIFEYPF